MKKTYTSSTTYLNDYESDREVDEYFAERRKTSQKKKYKMMRVKDGPEYEGLFKGYKDSPWKMIIFMFLTAVVVGLTIDKFN